MGISYPKSAVRRVVRFTGVVAGVYLIWVLYHAGIILGFWPPLMRPPGVSQTAHYVSLVESGTWFDCNVDVERDVNICRAWDSNGRLLADGAFRLDGENRAATEQELRPSNVIVDHTTGRGWMIYLSGRNGAFTKALVPADTKAH